MEEEEIDKPEESTATPSVGMTKEEEAMTNKGVSPFLRFQDKNGDKMPDACDVEIVPAENVCKDCIPNPQAISVNWRKTDQFSPFLNEKICKYQICFNTGELTTGYLEGMTDIEADRALRDMYKKYQNDAVVALLKAFQKDTSQGTVLKVLEILENTSFELAPHENSRLKLLYSVDFAKFSSLPDESVDEDEEGDDPGDVEVSYEATDMMVTNIRVRKGLNLYGRFAKVARAVEGKNIRFTESNKIFNLENYGDSALFTGASPVGELLRELESWLNGKGYQIPGVSGGFFTGLGDDKVKKLDFVFSSEYELKKLKVYTEYCGTNRPDIVYGRSKLESLNRIQAWKDPTAVAYFAKMKEIEADVSARTPMEFEDFVVKHTYPQVFVQGPNELRDGADPARTIDSCIRDALENDLKELGQDIFDEVFSLADAIAYKFHKNLCQADPAKVNEEALLKGLNFGAGPGPGTNIYGMAKMQAFDTINAEDSAFAQMCFRMLGMGMSGVQCGLSPIQQLDKLYAQGLDRMAVCGLMDLLLEALQCLFKGLSLEEALASIIRAALNAMGVSQVGELFVGLPPEKQQELQAAVNKKLKSGDIFPPGSPGQATSDTIAKQQSAPDANVLKAFADKKPWEDEKFVEQQENNKRADNYGNMTPSKSPNYSPSDGRERRTVGQKLQAPMGDDYQTNNLILNAYIEAFMEVYADAYLELLDLLNKFPGAQLIASIIALLDCPTPPLFNPGFEDFFKSLQLPFCRNIKPITFPRWENPFLYIPKLSDILKAIFEALKKLVFCLIMRIIILILAKVCEIIGDAICKALETVGQIGVGLVSGNTNVGAIIRETICGPDASDETVDNTILELMDNFGIGGAAFADPERTISFFGDFINSSTREETMNMFLEGPTQQQLDIANGLLDNEYEEFRSALPNNMAIETMVGNISNLVPAHIMNDIRDAQSLGSDDLTLPMNPTLCATPEALADFEQARCDLMAGRMSPEQCRAQNAAARDQILENVNDLNKVLNEGIGSVMENAMPPIFSDPDCDNGLLPFEPEESIKTATGALKGDMESLQIAYTDDMLGNGGLFGSDDDWGFINMALSDTFGNPFTAHQRKVYNTDRFVDFYIPNDATTADDNEFDVAPEKRQRAAYPYYVAGWLKYQFTDGSPAPDNYPVTDLQNSMAEGFQATNDTQKAQKITRTFKDLGFKGLFDTDVNVTEIVDFGYNTSIEVKFEKEKVNIIKGARKKSPDMKLKFRDNSKGYRQGRPEKFNYGFNLNAYYADIEEFDNPEKTGYFNIPSDNIRIKIVEKLNPAAKSTSSVEEKLKKSDEETDTGADTGDSITEYTKYEFFAIDDTLDNLIKSGELTERNYPNLHECFSEGRDRYSPPARALSDLTGLNIDTCNEMYKTINTDIYNLIKTTVGENEEAWRYGAKFDDLTPEDFDYGVKVDGEWVEYSEYQVPEYDDEGEPTGSDRDVENSDAVLGISKNQFNNPKNPRVMYLDPTQFGQNYMSPSLYVKPVKNKGWLGAVNLMFPEYTPCKPRSTNLIGFDDIQGRIDEVYSRIPEDERLKSDPDCVFEAPFNRILSRPARAGLEAVITALIRIFASTHFIKSLPVLATFEPKFPENYSNIYASYIIENMEDACINAGNNFLSPFKDNEFWYAFLEQSVQVYSRRLDDDLDESITPETVPIAVQEAIEKINQLQENYDQPSRKQFRQAPATEKSNFQTIKGYREEKVLEAVREVEEEAKIILLELVKEQLSHLSELFSKNLKTAGFTPEVTNVDYYFLENLAAGGGGLKISNAVEFVEKAGVSVDPETGAPIEGDDMNKAINSLKTGEDWTDSQGRTFSSGTGYTDGNQFSLPDGTPYFGEYHVHIDENGNPTFMVGAEHTLESHDALVPFAHNVLVGSVDADGEWTGIGNVPIDPAAGDKNFYIRKFVSLGDGEADGDADAAAENTVRGNVVGNLSDHYPGDIKLRTNSDGQPVGIDGNIGVQHCLEFGLLRGGARYPITTVRVDALDIPVSEFVGPRANSKLLLCLLDNLRDDSKFRMTVDYVFSMKKALATFAIYTDLAFLPSIGEYTVGKRDVFSKITGDTNKPGMRINGTTFSPEYTLGWAHESDRNKLFQSPFFRKWDEWDQVLLRKSTRRAKKIFRPHYRKRKFEVDDPSEMGAGAQYLNIAKERFKMKPGGNSIPWFKKRKVKPNPLNNKGQLCKKRN